MKISHTKGFTLIELLVVIAIIGLLSSVIIAPVNSARAKARDAKRMGDLKQLQVALTIYFDDYGTYPPCSAFSPWNQTNWGLGSASCLYTALVPTYIAALPKDPLGSSEAGTGNFLGDNFPTDKGYVYSSGGTTYVLGTNLEKSGSVANTYGNFQVSN